MKHLPDWFIQWLHEAIVSIWANTEDFERRLNLSNRCSGIAWRASLRFELVICRRFFPDETYGINERGVFVVG